MKYENNLTIGVHNIPAERYHADALCAVPSLSRSIAHTMIAGCPLKGWINHPRLNPNYEASDPTASMDFGSVGHELLLGAGGGIDIGEYDDFKTNAAKDWRKESRANGRTPVLRKTYDKAGKLREGALRWMKALGILPDFEASVKEQTIIFRSEQSYLRARPDAMLIDKGSGTINLLDLKVTNNAEPEACIKRIGENGFDLQSHFYTEAALSIEPDLRGRSKFLFLYIEDSFPFLVSAVELNGEFNTIARSKYNRALRLWSHCLSTNTWSGYSNGIITASPRPWDLAAEIEASTTE